MRERPPGRHRCERTQSSGRMREGRVPAASTRRQRRESAGYCEKAEKEGGGGGWGLPCFPALHLFRPTFPPTPQAPQSRSFSPFLPSLPPFHPPCPRLSIISSSRRMSGVLRTLQCHFQARVGMTGVLRTLHFQARVGMSGVLRARSSLPTTCRWGRWATLPSSTCSRRVKPRPWRMCGMMADVRHDGGCAA